MRPAFETAIARGLKLLCANPDIVVDRGEAREWCAGALARLYAAMGGESLYFGKPHPPVYDLARRRLNALGTQVPDHRIYHGKAAGQRSLGRRGVRGSLGPGMLVQTRETPDKLDWRR